MATPVCQSRSRTIAPGENAWVVWLFAVMLSAGIFVASYGPLLVEFAAWQWSRPHYQHFPFILAACGGLLASRWMSASSRTSILPGLRRTIFLLVVSWLVLLGGMLVYSPLLAALSAILLCGAACHEISRRRHVTYLWGIWAALWLILPIPLERDRQLVNTLQRASSWLSSAALDVVGVLHLMQGNRMHLPEKQLFVDEACSGIVSLLAILACAAIYGIWRNRPPFHVVVLGLAGIAWATLLNVTRISTIAFAYDRLGVDWSAGIAHEVLGAILFTIAFGALVATDQLLLALLSPVTPRFEETRGRELVWGKGLSLAWDRLVTAGAPSSATQPPDNSPTRSPRSRGETPAISAGGKPSILGGGFAAAFASLAILQFALYDGSHLPGSSIPSRPNLDRALKLDATTLPEKTGSFQQTAYDRKKRSSENAFGEYSSIYEYHDDAGRAAAVSCDFVFAGGWHELSYCYQAIDWQLDSRTLVTAADAAAEPWDYVEANFRTPDQQFATVLYCAFDKYGNTFQPPSGSVLEGLADVLDRRRQGPDLRYAFQVQVVLTSSTRFTEERLAAARNLLLVARDRFRGAISLQPNSTSDSSRVESPPTGAAVHTP